MCWILQAQDRCAFRPTIRNWLFIKTTIIHHNAIIKFPDLKGSEREEKKTDHRKKRRKICQGYYGIGSKWESYIKAADSHLLERNNRCDTCQPLWPGETIKQILSCLRAVTLRCWIQPKKKKRVMEGGETITIYIKSDPVLYCSSGTKKITVWSSLEILFSCKRGGGNVRRVTSEPSPPKIGLGITPSQLELKPCYVWVHRGIGRRNFMRRNRFRRPEM